MDDSGANEILSPGEIAGVVIIVVIVFVVLIIGPLFLFRGPGWFKPFLRPAAIGVGDPSGSIGIEMTPHGIFELNSTLIIAGPVHGDEDGSGRGPLPVYSKDGSPPKYDDEADLGLPPSRESHGDEQV